MEAIKMQIQKKKTLVRDKLKSQKSDKERISELESKVKELTERLEAKEAASK